MISCSSSYFARAGFVFLLIVFFMITAQPTGAQEELGVSLKLEVMREKFERLRAKEALAPREKLDAQYGKELERLAEKAKADGNLDLLLALQEEAKGFRARKNGAAELSKHAVLARAQGVYSKASARILEQVRSKGIVLARVHRKELDALATELTKEGKLESALEFRKERDTMDAIILEESAPVRGRYVRVQLPAKNYLSLAEVQVFSGKENIALKGSAKQSSTVGHNSKPVAKRAIDGNTDGNFSAGSITHTDRQIMPWWEVDLGAERGLTQIVIWNRTDQLQGRLDGFKLSVLDEARGVVWEKSFGKAPKRELAIDLGESSGR